jgi:hypothetical protein
MTRRQLAVFMIVTLATGAAGATRAQTPQTPAAARAEASAKQRTTLYFYTVKWGFQDEFLDLFQKNHHPLLKAQLGTRISAIQTWVPTYHGDGRADWTFVVALTVPETPPADSPTEAQLALKLFPDQARFRKEESRRFELLAAHWDVPLTPVDFETRAPVGR